MADLQERLKGRDAVIRSVVEDSCATLGPSLRSFVENFGAGLNNSVSEAFRAGFIGSQLHDGAAIDRITLRFSGGGASENGGGYTKGRDVFDPSVDSEVIEL